MLVPTVQVARVKELSTLKVLVPRILLPVLLGSLG